MTDLLMAFEPVLLCASSFAIVAGTLLVWRNRWNIPVYAGIAFWFVSQFVPIAVVGVHESFDKEIRLHYLLTQTTGAFFYTAGLIYSRLIFRQAGTAMQAWDLLCTTRIFRLLIGGLALSGVGLTAYAMLRMGYLPLFAENPTEAKQFRGEYYAAYQPVAIPFRLGMTLLTLAIPLILSFATSKISGRYKILFGVMIVIMALTLQRSATASGLILFIGVWLLYRRKPIVYALASLAIYIAGTLTYKLLAIFDLGPLAGVRGQTRTIWEEIASTAPDVTDQLQFMANWISADSPLTQGRTIFGGLIPDRYEWAPGVWTLTLGNQAADVNAIVSGGLRLQAPQWAEICFGLTGLILLTFSLGLAHGRLALYFKMRVPAKTEIGTILALSLYGAILNVASFTITYSAALTLLLTYSLIWFSARSLPVEAPATGKGRVMSARQAASRHTLL